ncbi:hypothetical protein BC834DRAFT_911341 [Gloeopeniophorella convolvens]|nr:hypothetical protein BC834DRAFT_911341 [Gloeopeniophorella convolvens]
MHTRARRPCSAPARAGPWRACSPPAPVAAEPVHTRRFSLSMRNRLSFFTSANGVHTPWREGAGAECHVWHGCTGGSELTWRDAVHVCVGIEVEVAMPGGGDAFVSAVVRESRAHSERCRCSEQGRAAA